MTSTWRASQTEEPEYEAELIVLQDQAHGHSMELDLQKEAARKSQEILYRFRDENTSLKSDALRMQVRRSELCLVWRSVS